MLALGPLAFANAWILLGLLSLPVIYWLLRVTPPAPRFVRFPALRLLLGLNTKEETPAHTPLWLLLLRLGLAALIILALAGPVWDAKPASGHTGPLIIVIDNGWASGEEWDRRRAALDDLLGDADRSGRPVLLAATAKRPSPEILTLGPAAEAARKAQALEPQPFATARMAALDAIIAANVPEPEIVWIADGLDDGAGEAFAKGLAALGTLRVIGDARGHEPAAITMPQPSASAFTFRILRPNGGPALSGSVRASASDGRFIGDAPFSLAEGGRETQVSFTLPPELRNAIGKVAIEGRASAGAVTLLDDRFRRRPVGLVSGSEADRAQPLLSDLYYLNRALEPYAELRRGSISSLLKGGLSVLILADVGQIVGSDHDTVAQWVEEGGWLVRFAGPRLAAKSDDLVPAPLRTGGRALGGAMSWEKPQGLGPFAANSPFAGLAVPKDVRVTRQVLAEPSLDLAEKTWARLEDGTPLVTAQRRGKGMLVLVHVTANADWSNLALSGLFLDMLRRLIDLSSGIETGTALAMQETATLPPRLALDGFGRLLPPPSTVAPVPAALITMGTPGPGAPPGLYGPQNGAVAFNLLRQDASLSPLPPLPDGTAMTTLGERAARDLSHGLLAVALAMMLADFLISLILRGLAPLPARAAGTAAGLGLALIVALLASPRAMAQEGDDFALKAALQTRLAYVITGDSAVDEMSAAGLAGLTQILNQRTAVDAAEPIGIDIERDELAFFPLLYWPMGGTPSTLSPAALAKVDAFMKNGGTILFDTRDADMTTGGTTGPGEESLRELLRGLDIPPLVPVPEGHVLTKAFYLLSDFPGRYDTGQVWVEAPSGVPIEDDPNAATASSSDGVSAIIVGSNDWASAWARDESGRPLAPVTPGGERQREMATRFGVNVIMYTLTGNYKSDQVHVPALLERLGQ
ncbi:MAG: DUF4159 domain-containing protein [Alphaproteobacteria bacterium]|nr:DUF4159 domain-containing protein [Alphaproteobacteria bacterium]